MMNIKYLFFFILLAFGQTISAQASSTSLENSSPEVQSSMVNPVPFAATITSDDLRKHLSILASDEFEGRETGTEGNQKAADYIAGEFKRMGLPAIGDNDSYFQQVAFNWTRWDKIAIEVNQKKFRHLWEFIAFPTQNRSIPELKTNEVVFLGYGIDDPKYSDYQGKNVKDKVIMVYKGEPLDKKGNSRITGNTSKSDWTNNWEKKVETAQKHGVKLVLFIENEIQEVLSENRNLLIGPRITLGDEATNLEKYTNSCYINTNVAKAIMGKNYKKVVKARKKITKKGKPISQNLPCDFQLNQSKKGRTLKGVNVLGFIEGTDENLKDEIVIVTAHYDHLGKRGEDIYNGADDNGSGTSTVLEIAEAMAEAKKQGSGPRRSVLTMLVTGEEKGLLGSKFYAEKPIFPLENTVANVNVDMVGRVDKKYAENPNYIYVIGSDRLSTELHEINETVNQKYTNLTLDYTYNAEDDPNRYYYRSDHYNFAEKGIPAIFYFNGTHADYHRTSDTIEKINFEKMETIGKLVFHTTWELANRDKKIEVDVK